MALIEVIYSMLFACLLKVVLYYFKTLDIMCVYNFIYSVLQTFNNMVKEDIHVSQGSVEVTTCIPHSSLAGP